MSRVAKNPVKLPAGVEVKLVGQQLSVKGAKGTLELNIHSSVRSLKKLVSCVSLLAMAINKLAQWPAPLVHWLTTWSRA